MSSHNSGPTNCSNPSNPRSLLRRLEEKAISLPIGDGLSISWLELQAILLLIACTLCACCSVSAYVWGSESLRLTERLQTHTPRPTRMDTPASNATGAAPESPISTPVSPPTTSGIRHLTETAVAEGEASSAKRQTPTPPSTHTLTPTPPVSPPSTPIRAPEPSQTPTPEPSATSTPPSTDTPTPTPTLTNTPTLTVTPTLTDTPTPTLLPSDLRIASVEHSPAGSDLDGEYVQIENLGEGDQDMSNWVLTDEEYHYYRFPDGFVLPGGVQAAVKVWTKSGSDTSDDLYWGLDDPVWGDQDDVAYLWDNTWTLIDSLTW